ncbi:MAG: NUDIX domain-containing protein [Gammaproteobacteria bacterium]|nr:NUDIX domain-containing protein [Gammaproteobacteria bacterium]
MSAPGGQARALAVVAGILVRDDGRVLLAQRPAGRDHAGLWEFPGGKREPGERRRQALARELEEELGLTLARAAPLVAFEYVYPGRRVALDFWWVTDWSGAPVAREGQAWAWLQPDELLDLPLLAANRRLALWLWLHGCRRRWRRAGRPRRLQPPAGLSVTQGPGVSLVVAGAPVGRQGAALRARWLAACRAAGHPVAVRQRRAPDVPPQGVAAHGPARRRLPLADADLGCWPLRRGRHALALLRGAAARGLVFETRPARPWPVSPRGQPQPQWSRIQGVGRIWRYHLPPRPSRASSGFGLP